MKARVWEKIQRNKRRREEAANAKMAIARENTRVFSNTVVALMEALTKDIEKDEI